MAGSWLAAAGIACSAAAESTAPTPTSSTPPPAAPTTPAPPPPVEASAYPEFIAGTAPLIIIAPHGGDLTPSTVPDRTCSACTTVNDANTQDLARQIADSFAARTGKRPSLVINRLHRRKFDANREIVEATGGYAPMEPVWTAFHVAIDSAKKLIAGTPGRGLVIDLHGHAHAIPRLELGYLLSDATLRLSDSALVAQGNMARTSIARLVAERTAGAQPLPAAALLRGSASLGALLVAAALAAFLRDQYGWRP